jgi:small subunit ribosomal protein S17
MQKTVVVQLRRRIAHPLYGKQATRTKRVVAHDDAYQAREGDVVRVMETRPLSKTKRWRVVGIVSRAE